MTPDANVIRIQRPLCTTQSYSQPYDAYSKTLFVQNLLEDSGLDFDSTSCFNFNGGMGGAMGNMWGDPMSNLQMQYDMQGFQLEKESEMRKRMAKVQHEENAPIKNVDAKIARIQKFIDKKQFDKITGEDGAFNALIEAEREKLLKTLGYEPSKEDSIEAAKEDFAAANGGMELSDSIEENGRTPFGAGVFCLWDKIFGSSKPAHKVAAEIDGTPVSQGDKAWEATGTVLGIAGLGLLAIGLLRGRRGGLQLLKRSRMTSKMGKLDNAYESAKAMRKANKGSISKADLATLKQKRKGYKNLVTTSEAKYQSDKIKRLTKNI